MIVILNINIFDESVPAFGSKLMHKIICPYIITTVSLHFITVSSSFINHPLWPLEHEDVAWRRVKNYSTIVTNTVMTVVYSISTFHLLVIQEPPLPSSPCVLQSYQWSRVTGDCPLSRAADNLTRAKLSGSLARDQAERTLVSRLLIEGWWFMRGCAPSTPTNPTTRPSQAHKSKHVSFLNCSRIP